MEVPDTDTLRKLAPCWTLAGDERLLTILQNTHQRLVSKCQEANAQLEQMTAALDDASISLQNVNNQFMALSSSQFIESRVYDDDADVATDAPAPKESPKPPVPDELSILKRSIAVIESTHEVITILHDSDTESDSDDELPDRLVMKPKDLYAERPLPYIIGSEPWKNKWHAGLLPEDTDTDSSTSKVDRESDQYSLSENEEFDPVQQKTQGAISVPQHVRKISETSSDLPSEATPTSKPTPSDVASEIARRLGGGVPPKIEREPEYEEPERPAAKKIYKPQEPVSSTIFPDEPPPLDQSEDESDIFADLHRNQPYSQPYSQPYGRNYVTDQLFADDTDQDDGGDIFSDFANQPSNATKPTSLFDAGPKPHMFDRQPATEPPRPTVQPRTVEQPGRAMEQPARTTVEQTDDTDDRVKKPVGGISLFGSNKGADSIGAAILKRNRRKSSTSGEESANDAPEPPPIPNEPQTKKEKDIFDDLFAKSEAKKLKPKGNDIVKDIKHEILKKNEEKVKKDAPKPVDLFSDNLFDDIDDIFTTNIVKTSKDNKKSIFEDDDDLFSEIAQPKPVKQDIKNSSDVKKSLFDSDDDLFSENIVKEKPSISNKTESVTIVREKPTKPTEITKSNKETNKVTKDTSIFDDDEDNIFSNIKTSKVNDVTKVQNVTINKADSLTKNIETKKVFNSPSLFDDDDESDLFAETVKPKNSETVNKDPIIQHKTEIITEEIPEKDIHITISSPENDVNVISSSTEVSQKEIESKTDAVPSSSVKTDVEDTVYKQDDIEETKIHENASNTEISPKVNSNIDPEDVKPTNIDSNTKITAIDKMLEDNNDRTTDDDFSEQDFDDDVQETTPSEHVSEKTETQHIFDNTAIEDDIFASPHKIPNNIPESMNPDNKTDAMSTSDIFTDIVTEPPAFEKPKEPKKSKNVNALFDDDSDDEALFFKKEDVISDERPEDFTVKQDRLFGIFADEPPDVDFTKINDDLDDDLFSTLPKPKIPNDISQINDFNDDLAIPELPDSEISEDIPIFDSTPDPVSNDKDDIKNSTTEDKQPLPETKPVIESKDNSNDIFREPAEESVKEISSIYNNDMFKEPASLINTTEEQEQEIDDDETLFKSLPVQLPQQITKTINKIETDYQSDEELFKSLPIIEKSQIIKETPKPLSNKDIFKLPLQRSNSTNTDLKDKSEVKKVGKLKVGLNINVNALLPGASPKKVKPIDSPDGQSQSAEIQKDEPAMTKSVSFDGKPGSEILDNKLSKERPRIQVKRRPSTRKARREAVRKSGIDFGDDSTDNSSSIDDPPKPKSVHKVEETNSNIDNTDTNDNINIKPETPKVESHDTQTKSEIQAEKLDITVRTEPEKQPVKSDSTTKIVYILNDEDIFNTSAIDTKPDQTRVQDPTEAKSNDVEASLDSNLGIKTLGNTYKATDGNKSTGLSLFGEDLNSEADDVLFKNKKPVAKSKIFDSDSEEELFGNSKKENVKKVEIVKDTRGSLFGDDDDDDLFGVKTKKSVEPQPQTSRAPSVKETTKSTQPVFEDPLSMFGDDD